MGRSWGAQSGLWDPILRVEGQSPDQGTRLSPRGDLFCLWPCMPHHEISKDESFWELNDIISDDMHLFPIRSKFHLMFIYRTCILIKVHYLMKYVKISPDTFCIFYFSFFTVTQKNTFSPTSSVISVAMDLPISWYWGPLPWGPKSRKRNLQQKKKQPFPWNTQH